MCIKSKWSVYGYHRLLSPKEDVVLHTTRHSLKTTFSEKEDNFHWSTCIYHRSLTLCYSCNKCQFNTYDILLVNEVDQDSNGPSGWGTSKLDSIRIFYIQLLSTVHGIMLNFCNNNYSFKIPWLNETGTPQFIPTRHLYMAGRVLFRVGHTPCLQTAVNYVNKKMKSNKKNIL